MAAVYFYHLTRKPLEATLPGLLERSVERGWNVLVRGRDAARLDWLDQRLWLGPEEGFLAHGLAGGPQDAAQPVLLTLSDENPNGSKCLMAIDGADVAPGEVAGLERVCILFDGNDPLALARARGQWKALVEAGCGAKYWSEETGRWQMKAEAGSADQGVSRST